MINSHSSIKNKRNSRVKKFFSYYRPYLGLFLADMFCAVTVAAITLTIPLIIRHITKNFLILNSTEALQQIYLSGALLLFLIIVYAVCLSFITYKGHVMGALMERDMRTELFEHYQKLSLNFYDEYKIGQLMTRITNDSFELAELYHHGPEDIVICLFSFIGVLTILFNINTQLALITLIFLLLMILYGYYFSKKMHAALRTSRDRIGDINAQVEDSLAGIRVVKSFTNEDIERKKFAYENDRFLASRKIGYKNETFFYEGLITFTQLMTVTIVILGAVQIVHGYLDLADLLTFSLYIGILIEPIQKLGNFTRLYQEGITGFERFMEMLEIEPQIKDAPNAVEIQHMQGNIIFEDVSFRYKEKHNHVLKNVSLNVQAGEYVALVGPSGAGKTTLCSLIPRFYEVNSGQITIDGKNINTVSLHTLRKNIGIVHQDIYLFSGTVLENIRYGQPTASQAEIIEAAKKANAHDFIMKLPNGYSTDIGQRGVKLSGGQKQRLSIARVILKNPAILILDEATSSLDNESEAAVQISLKNLCKNRTTLVIAHRLSTVRQAQRIIVLTERGIEEQGTHEELLALSGVYANLYTKQLKM